MVKTQRPTPEINKKVAAFRGMHVSPAKYSYESVTDGQTDRRTDGQTDGWTDRQTMDKVIPMCRYPWQATKKKLECIHGWNTPECDTSPALASTSIRTNRQHGWGKWPIFWLDSCGIWDFGGQIINYSTNPMLMYLCQRFQCRYILNMTHYYFNRDKIHGPIFISGILVAK